jgi:glycosyltransferase involved in cell wall biosynthesis
LLATSSRGTAPSSRMSADMSGLPTSSARVGAGVVRAESAAGERRRVLYIYSETVGLNPDSRKNPLHWLSAYMEGDYMAVWVVDGAAAAEKARAMAPANGSFRFHWTRWNVAPPGLRRLWQVAFFTGKGLALTRRHGRYDAIVTYGPFMTALTGIMLRMLTGAKLIVEFPGHPFRNYDMYQGSVARLKRLIAPSWTRFVASTADHIRLLFPSQLDDLGLDVSGKASVFHDFVAVPPGSDADEPVPRAESKYILFLGFPFHLKGVDLLIRAFNRISHRFSDYRLLIVGYCPDPTVYQELAAGNPRIEIRPPVPHDEAMALMAGCSIFAMASRIEGMPRVLIEAMSAGKPVVASAVGGIPHYVEHGETGLLFESENVDDLAANLERVLGDRDFAAGMARRGQEFARSKLSEEQYAVQFRAMIDRATAPA